MAYKNIVFVKLEKRLLNDWRWCLMSDQAQLLYIKLILLAAETYNKIPKNDSILKEAVRSRLELDEFRICLNEIRTNFPKFKCNKHFYYFDEFENKTNYLPSKQSLSNRSAIAQTGADKEKEEDIDKEKEKKSSRFASPSLEELTNYISENNYTTDPNQFIDFYQSKGWMVGKNKMKDWRAAVRNWEKSNGTNKKQAPRGSFDVDKYAAEREASKPKGHTELVPDTIPKRIQ